MSVVMPTSAFKLWRWC